MFCFPFSSYILVLLVVSVLDLYSVSFLFSLHLWPMAMFSLGFLILCSMNICIGFEFAEPHLPLGKNEATNKK